MYDLLGCGKNMIAVHPAVHDFQVKHLENGHSIQPGTAKEATGINQKSYITYFLKYTKTIHTPPPPIFLSLSNVPYVTYKLLRYGKESR